MEKVICSRCQCEFDVQDGDFAEFCPGCTAQIAAKKQGRQIFMQSQLNQPPAEEKKSGRSDIEKIVLFAVFVAVVISGLAWWRFDSNCRNHETDAYLHKKAMVLKDLREFNSDWKRIYENWIGEDRPSESGIVITLSYKEMDKSFGLSSGFPYMFLPKCNKERKDLHLTEYRAVCLVATLFSPLYTHRLKIYANSEKEYATEEQVKMPRKIIYFTDLAIKALENPESARELVDKEWDKWMAEPAGTN